MVRRLSRHGCRASGAGAGRARRGLSSAAFGAPASRRGHGGDLRRFRTHRHARHDALAAPALLRLFPGQRRARPRSSPNSVRGARRAMHALADLARRDRARDPGARLAAPDDRPARRLLGRHPGFGLGGDARRRSSPPRERALAWPATATGLPASRVARLCLGTGALLDRPAPAGSPASASDNLVRIPVRGRPRSHGSGSARRRRSSRTARPGLLPAGIIACIGGTSIGACDDVAAVARSRGGTASTCTSTPPGPAAAMICPEFRHSGARRRAGRQLRLQPAQMAVHAIRLLGAFRARSRTPPATRWPSARPSSERTATRGLRRLQRVVAAARPALPGPEALVRHSRLRRRGPAGA